jgi:ketosteroid isomerase-like protein
MPKKVLFPLLLILAAAACHNPFSTRTPEEPPEGGAVILPPTSPERVLHNLEEAVKAGSIQDYLDVFSDDFRFAPDPGDSLAYEQYFQSRWTKEREGDFALNFFQQAQLDSTFAFDLFTYAESRYDSSERMYKYHYSLSFGKQGGDETKAWGIAWLFFRENSEGKWSIYLWADQRSLASAPTWGVLRAQYQ